jgi:hypothetical protein
MHVDCEGDADGYAGPRRDLRCVLGVGNSRIPELENMMTPDAKLLFFRLVVFFILGPIVLWVLAWFADDIF